MTVIKHWHRWHNLNKRQHVLRKPHHINDFFSLCILVKAIKVSRKFLHWYKAKTYNFFLFLWGVFWPYRKRNELAPGLRNSTPGSCEEKPLNSEQAEEINQYPKIIQRWLFLLLWTVRRSNSFIFLLGCFKTPKKPLLILWSARTHTNSLGGG